MACDYDLTVNTLFEKKKEKKQSEEGNPKSKTQSEMAGHWKREERRAERVSIVANYCCYIFSFSK